MELKQPSLQGLETVAKKIEDLNGTANPKPIEKVEYGKGSIEKLFQITSIVRNVGLVFVILLSITSIFLISNTIKLTILNRRREISIMKLVGATNQFIRWPFFVEGALLGLIGSLIPIGVLLYGYYEIVISTREDLGLVMINLLTIPEVSYILVGILLAIGIVIGIWGSTLSVRKYLKV
nr:FtsX-like permease family protein [Paenibacillus larvae]